MRIECPDCAAAYDVPEALVAPGREVRCVRCAHGWVPRAAPDTADLLLRTEAPSLPPVAMAEEHLPAVIPPRPPASRGPVVMAWIFSLAVIGGAGFALWHYRVAVVAAWPPSARLFGWISAIVG
ncbi:zinc-ribbon domain-containing protein [Roseomonas sp. 18066]|uniref:zinc-ribbon domain-containing protein n=1 Tax=Roseomonas sp. 18066 TaxID=2681412 RepID=UPI001359C4D0|nr:zinc-ribbon domain-containing protein [Roseomonas sp. 18066]